MSSKDVLKVLTMLAVVFAAVALYCYARVDLGMTQVQVNQQLEQWVRKTSMLSMVIWSQIIVAVVAGLGFKIWQHRSTKARLSIQEKA